MLVDLVLLNGKLHTAQGILDAGIAIDDGRIVRIAKRHNLPSASENVDMKGCHVLPGLIDSHVHLRDQQFAYKEDFTTGTMAAAAGGVTTVIDMPNNKPVTMDSKSLNERMNLAENRLLVNVAFNSAFPERLKDIESMVKLGAVGLKLYFAQQIGGTNIDDDNALASVFRKAAECNIPVAVHAEDKSTLEAARKKVRGKAGNNAEAFLNAHPPEAEVRAIKHALDLAKQCGTQVHICHLSSARGLKSVLEAKNARMRVTCEVTPHHLLLTERELKKTGNIAVTLPPLRSKTDTLALWRALKRGLIDTIASDHAPHSIDEKTTESIWETKPGIPGLETMLPLLLTEVNKNRLTMLELVKLMSEKPAEVFRLKGRGRLNEGDFADIVVVDMKQKHKIDASNFHSKAKFSPFDGWRVTGKAMKTFVNGKLVMDGGEVVGKPGAGLIVRRVKNEVLD